MHKSNRGFTLIELLVVIAIIGILSSVVLASLNTARGKGADANVKSNLANARSQAELFYSTNSDSYAGVCAAAANAAGVKSIQAQVIGAGAATGYTAVAGDFLTTKVGNTTSITCRANSTNWAAEAPLKTQNVFGGASGVDMWCVDSSGVSKVLDTTSFPNAGVGFACL